MSVQKAPTKAVASVSEVARMCNLSRSRFYTLIHAGVFPLPVQNAPCNRPVYVLEAQRKCLEIRQTGIGVNGLPVVFNRKLRARTSSPAKVRSNSHTDGLLEAIKSLGLATTAEDVGLAIREVFPDGTEGTDQGEIIKALFLHLQQRK